MKWLALTFALGFSHLWAKEEPPEPTDYIRAVQDEKSARLETAITRFEKDGVKVDLIGAVHIADESYYDALNEGFKLYDVVLFEAVGGEKLVEMRKRRAAKKQRPQLEQPAPEGKAADNGAALNLISSAVSAAARFLELEQQMIGIDYMADNFVHADVTLQEFRDLQEKKKETLMGTLVSAQFKAQPKNNPNMLRIIKGLVTGNANTVKKELLQSLAEGDEQVQELFGESVIILDRNLKALWVLENEVAKNHDLIAIFYGAAHFPHMEQELVKRGYQRTKQTWLPAWTVPVGKKP